MVVWGSTSTLVVVRVCVSSGAKELTVLFLAPLSPIRPSGPNGLGHGGRKSGPGSERDENGKGHTMGSGGVDERPMS